jgi:DNA polymerase III gamma/tau subunit
LSEASLRAASGGAGDVRVRELLGHLLDRRLAEALNLVAAVRDDGIDLRQFTRDCVQALRAALLVCAGATASLDLGEEAVAGLGALAGERSTAELARVLRLLMSADFRADPLSPLPLELAIIESVDGPAVTTAAPATGDLALAPAPTRSRASGPPAERPAPSAADRMRALQSPRTGPPPAPLVAKRDPAARPIEPTGSPADPEPGQTSPAEAPAAVAQEAPAGTVPALASENQTETATAAPTGASPSEPAPDAGGEPPLSLDAARRRMLELFARVNAIDRNSAALLKSPCDIVSISESSLVLGFKHKPLAQKAQQPAALAALQQAAADLFVRPLVVSCVHEPDAIDRARALLAERPSHLLDEALKLGARPLEKTT